MAERIPDDADLAVDELKRRARRRLVGAIVLALAAAVILPLLLEKEPKPLGDDVSVQIPPVDEGRFVNRLTGRTDEAKPNTKSDARPPKAAPPKIDTTKIDTQKTDAQKTDAPKTDTQKTDTQKTDTQKTDTQKTDAPKTDTQKLDAATADTVAPAPSETAATPTNVPPARTSVAEAEKKVLAGAGKGAPAAKSETPPPAPVTPPVASPPSPTPVAVAPASTPAAGEGFAVQIAAFTDDKGANALAGKLKKAGYASTYIEPVETSRGTLWRVRVGGFATRPDADAARARLKTDGWNGIVVSGR